MFVVIALALAAAQPQEGALPAPAAGHDEAAGVDWEKEFGIEKKVRDPVTGEFPVDPYTQSPANAGAAPFARDSLVRDFGGQDGIRRIVNRFVDINIADRRVEAIFRNQDMVRLRRTLFEQVCYLLDAGCVYTGRDMKAAHKGLGTTRADLNAVVENLQQAMREHKVPFPAQNRLLAKLAPMAKDIVER